jgi:hypothetical protein
MYSTLNIYNNSYNFICRYSKPHLSANSLYETFQLLYYSIILSNSNFVLDDYQTSTEHAHDLTALILSQHMRS